MHSDDVNSMINPQRRGSLAGAAFYIYDHSLGDLNSHNWHTNVNGKKKKEKARVINNEHVNVYGLLCGEVVNLVINATFGKKKKFIIYILHNIARSGGNS